jgi:predicted phosphodiesterase
MTKLVVVSDIHSNAVALQAVVDREGSDEQYAVLGDVAGLLGYPQETVRLVRELDGPILAGNHDRAIFHEGVGHVNSQELSEFELSHTINTLSHEQIDWMQERPYLDVVQYEDSRICLCHAYPFPERASGFEAGNAGVEKRDVPQIASVVADDYDYVLAGHTHEQYDVDCSKFGHDVHFVNPGSLGYQHTYSVLDTEASDITHKSVDSTFDRVREHLSSVLPDNCPNVNRWL